MASAKQKSAARKNVKKAAKAAEKKRTISQLPKRVKMALGKKGAKAKEGGKGPDGVVAAVRDTTLTVLGRQSADDLLAVNGKEHLKVELKAALAKHNPELKVADVYFTDFLVQW